MLLLIVRVIKIFYNQINKKYQNNFYYFEITFKEFLDSLKELYINKKNMQVYKKVKT